MRTGRKITEPGQERTRKEKTRSGKNNGKEKERMKLIYV